MYELTKEHRDYLVQTLNNVLDYPIPGKMAVQSILFLNQLKEVKKENPEIIISEVTKEPNPGE